MDEVQVVILQSADVATESAMDERLASVDFDVSAQKDGTVKVSARCLKPMSFSWSQWPPVNLVYEIKVPARCDVKAQTSEGRIVIGSLKGAVDVSTETGSVFVGEVDGPVTAWSNSGHVGVTAATGPVSVATLTGNITVGRAGAETRVSSCGGYMEIQRAGGEVVLRGSGSDAQVGFAAPMQKPADISLSGGTLTLILETNCACTLDARASIFGKIAVRGELLLTVVAGGAGRSRLKADVNGGGPRIQAQAKGGSVLIRAVEPLAVAVVPHAVEPKF